MSRYRLVLTLQQELILRQHCAHARLVWNVAVEQHQYWRPGRAAAPGFAAQCRQARRGSGRRSRVRVQAARLQARQTDLRKDWCETTSTEIARRFDLSRVEDLRIRSMTRSARESLARPGRNVAVKTGLNREIMASGWGLLARRLEDKARGRVEKVNPAYTSQRCSACGTVDARARESQAVFSCRSCGYVANADVNAARNIAAGQAVTARGGWEVSRPVNREPRHDPLSV